MNSFGRLMTPALLALCALVLLVPPSARAKGKGCNTDAVQVGPLCVDKYEASVWSFPPGNAKARQKLMRKGGATVASLTAAGATLHGSRRDDYPASCGDDGNGCKDQMYAFSIPGVLPSAYLTWFQAQQACANAGKRLLRNGEWQMAAAGTPDPGTDNGTTDCNVEFLLHTAPTGSRASCVSAWGAYDMVGNRAEWVEDWVPLSTGGVLYWFSGDLMTMLGASTVDGPGALIRGGSYGDDQRAGVFALSLSKPTAISDMDGFRCAR